jgi:methylated-DNA-[protein]-cysteine S-methyltransferase
MVTVTTDHTLLELTFGIQNEDHPLPPLKLAGRWLTLETPRENRDRWLAALIDRLKRYADGAPVDFRDIRVDGSRLTPFQASVIPHCRHIPYGQTMTYGQLAQLAGSPSAARSVGTTMARNKTPIVVPCHRVVASNGTLGGFSAPGGITMKERLLKMEQAQA